MTENERRAAHRLLADYPMAGLDTVAGLGESAGVSAPTVLRMISKLGYASYGNFQKDLRTELAERLASPLMKGGDAPPGSDHLGAFTKAVLDNIRDTAANIAADEFTAVVRLLSDPARQVQFLGGRFTDPLADYFVAHLRVVRSGVRHVGGGRAAWLDQLLDLGKRDIVVLFDIRRYSTDLAEYAAGAAKRGATIVLFTDQWLSPISKMARHVLAAHVAVPSIWDSNASMLVLIEATLAAITRELGPAARERLSAIESLRSD
jgi:DNA-binding MurR/RpiR family transcriptional regulator